MRTPSPTSSANPTPSRFGRTTIASALHDHVWFIAGALACLLAFGWVITGGTGRVIAEEAFGDLYDHQCASLLRGRLDVPEEAIVFEAFAYEGKLYTYWGVTPALLRIPLVVLNAGFGQLARLYMLLYFAATLLAAYLLLLEARRMAGAKRPPAAWVTLLLVANVGLGSTVFFLSSRAYVYHESILCGITFALWAIWCALRWYSAPASRWWIGSLVCGVLSVHARPPTGLLALTALGVAACALVLRERSRSGHLTAATLRRPLLAAIAAGLGVLSFNAVSYAKFGTFEGCPLRYNVQYDAARLARIDGRQFHPGNVGFGITAYVTHPGFRLTPYFPYFLIDTAGPPKPPRAKIDLVEPVLAFPYAMPALFGLATIGSGWAFVRAPALRGAIAIVGLAGLPMSVLMCAAVAVSHRYTADFCPLLIALAAFPLAALDSVPARQRKLTGLGLGVLTFASISVTALITLHYQRERVWGVPDEFRQAYGALRQRMDSLFGRTNPNGYDALTLRVRAIDAGYRDWLIRALLKKPDIASAVARYERESNPTAHSADTHFKLADVYIAQNRTSDAIAALQRGLVLRPDQAAALARLGDLLIAEGHVADAIQRYRAVLQLVPNFAIVHNNLGVAYAKAGQSAAAIAHIEQALRIDPNYADARRNLEALRAAQPQP